MIRRNACGIDHYGVTRRRVTKSVLLVFFFQAEDGIRDLVRSRGLGDVYKRQVTLQCLEMDL